MSYVTQEEIEVGGEYGTCYGKVKVVYIKHSESMKLVYVCIDIHEKVMELYESAFKLKKKVDWSKVPVDTKIFVTGIGNRYFSHYDPDADSVFFWGGGATSWSADRTAIARSYIVGLV